MASPGDLSDIEQLQKVLDEISACVDGISEVPELIKEKTKDATSDAGELVEGLLTKEIEETEKSLEMISDTIVALQNLGDQITKDTAADQMQFSFPGESVSEIPLEVEAEEVEAEEVEAEEVESAEVESEAVEETSSQPETAVSEPVSASSVESKFSEMTLDDDDIELIGDFLSEASEHIESAEAGLLTLETSPEDSESINLIFRGFHTIKGMAGFLNLEMIGALAHAAENLLDLARKGELELVGTNMDVIFESLDLLKTMIEELQGALNDTKVVPVNPKLDDLLPRINACVESDAASAVSAPVAEKAEAVAEAPAVEVTEEAVAAAPAVEVTEEAVQAPAAAKVPVRARQGTDEKIKVSTQRLDNLVNMVGEMVISQSMVLQDAAASLPPEHELVQKITHQGKLVRELQELSMMMRMVPIQGVFQKMARLVRDLCQKSGKKVNFTTEGEETELDRIVVDQIADPLVHMIRNSMDHGIESVEERATSGKDAEGIVKLRAFHQAGNIVIEIEDDGKGLNRDKILKKAIDNGIVAEGQEMSDQDVYKLVFHAGLSTAAKVTEVSGRGVGMDVVKKNIESLRGKVDIDSTQGKGSVFTIRLPLTMAIIEGQIVRVGDSKYIVPIVSIESCLRPDAKHISTVQGRGEMAMVQNELVSIVRLYKLFGDTPKSEVPCECSLVVVEEDGKKGALMVDELLGQQQVVIKNLGEGIGSIKGIAGGAIMGDGKISLIVDVPGLLGIACE